MNFLFLVTILFASSEMQNEMKHHLRRLQQTCDPVCDTTSDAQFCHIVQGEAVCGCEDDNVCSAPQVCVDASWPCDDSVSPPTCAKTCGCEYNTNNGCDQASESPYCGAAFTIAGMHASVDMTPIVSMEEVVASLLVLLTSLHIVQLLDTM